MSIATEQVILYEAANGIASVTMRRPEVHNAQDAEMALALEAAFRRAADDHAVKVIVLRGAGLHFSVGHQAAECSASGEQESYLRICRRLRELPKPTIAMVQGACIASGLLLASACDLILASDDAVFSNPVVRTGFPVLEALSHDYELHPRIVKELLFLGERMNAQRAYQMGMVNRVVPRYFLEEETYCMAARIARMPAAGLTLAKQAVKRMEDGKASLR